MSLTNTRRKSCRRGPRLAIRSRFEKRSYRPAIAGRGPLLRALLCATALISACADKPSAVGDPGAEQHTLRCASHETLLCIEKQGKTVRCTCSSRDDLRKILEPDKR